MKQRKEIIGKVHQKVFELQQVVGRLGATMRVKRKEKIQTLSGLSQLFDVSVSYLSKIENDVMKPNIEYISGVLADLQINEELFTSALVMNEWYEKLIKHVLGIENHKKALKETILARKDFQAKLMGFCLNVHESNFFKIEKEIKILLHSISSMHAIELNVFVYTLASYYIKTERYFAAGEVLNELKPLSGSNHLLQLWDLELRFELALCQPSFFEFTETTKKLTDLYFLFGLTDKIVVLRERYLIALSYFLSPDDFVQYLDCKAATRSYRLSHIYHKEYGRLEELEKEYDLAQLLLHELKGQHKEAEKMWLKVDYEDDPLEQGIKEYFKKKYDLKLDADLFDELIYTNKGANQHYYFARFISNILIDELSAKHMYKKCYLIDLKVKELEDYRKQFIKLS